MKHVVKFLSTSFVLSLSLALAHAYVETSTPEDGAVLTEAPTEIVLNFKEDIEAKFSIFKVYPLPTEMIADAATLGESTSGESTHSDEEAHAESEAEHSESETHSEGETSSETHSESDTHSESSESGEHSAETEHSAEHNESSEHSALDAAAKIFVPTVIDLTDDEDARVDMSSGAGETANSVTISLKESLAPGAYVVIFRVLSADTHTVEGFITFEIKP